MSRSGYHIPLQRIVPEEPTEDMFRRLIEFSYQIGRQYKAGGGTADIEAAIRAAKDVQDKRGAEHKVGMSSEVEFAPVSVSEPLTGKKFELGRLPEPTARVVEPIVQTAADVGPYFTPAAPVAAARDIAAGLKHGDPTELATAALGAPGKYAKAALVGASAFIPEEAEAGPLSSARMAVMHAMEPHNVVRSKGLGALVSPSLGIGKPAQNPLSEFGDVVLVGKKHLAEPGKENPVFSQDVWTPRFPKTENYNNPNFHGEGFYSMAQRKDVPATVENVLREMKSRPLVGGEYRVNELDEADPNFGYLVGRSAKMFKTPEEVLGARDRLMPKIAANREYNNANLTHSNLAFELSHRRPAFDEQQELNDADYLGAYLLAKKREKEIPWGGKTSHLMYPGMTPEEQAAIEEHARSLENLPSAYFEAKPQRAVKFDEFAGAVVPTGDNYEHAVNALKELGISNIVRNPRFVSQPGEYILDQFPEHTFAEGGEVEREHFDKGGIAAALKAAARAAEEASKRIPIERAREMVASPFSESPESVQNALKYAQSLRVPQGEERIPGSFYNVKQTRPVSEVASTIQDIPGVQTKDINPMSWEDIVRQYKGATLFNVAGDRSNLGRMTHINERELAWPVDLHAGPKYMLEPNEGAVWANNPAHATGFQKAIAEAAKRGPVIGAYHPMGVQSVDSSHNMIDALLAQIGRGDVDRDAMRAVDEMLRKGVQADKDKVELAKEAMQNWPGFENARESSEFARGLEGTRRSEIVKFLDKSPMLKRGFPAVGETRVAITDPALRDVSGNMLGHRLVEFDPQTLSPKGDLAFTHSTYTSPTAGRYVGDVPMVQTQYAMPDVERDIMTKLAKGDRVVHPYSTDPLGRSSWRKSFETRKLGQEVNQEMLDSIMRGIERQKHYGLSEGGAADRDDFDAGGKTISKALKLISAYIDPPTKHISNWNWRPLSDVRKDVPITEVPEHVQNFGHYMRDISDKASTEGLDPEDLIKSYMITRSSIQREGRTPQKISSYGIPVRESAEDIIRPEGHMADFLSSPIGVRFLNEARRGDLSQDVVDAAVGHMRPFGLSKTEPDAMDWARRNLVDRTPIVSDLVARGARGESPPAEWREFTRDVRGIGPAKTGFIGSLLGRGDLPTLDARQAILHTGMKNAEAQDIMAKNAGRAGHEAVDRLAARQTAMDLALPAELSPFYQHLAHHSIWDAVGNEKTTHQDIIDAMRPRAEGGSVIDDALDVVSNLPQYAEAETSA